ncbi:hypothetical protein L195_g054455 [Trifolium pratense]|uniref:Uncharacterized protein n=4 Tax=Trifolium pratense TaxID=57577 RepID=A0ACB0JPM7_TRIPR|nr:hypothetical protein L195_g054455 [Trifolium pratense]CAJ2645946.1 unnamed protein product [Trifolium pratense]CAJ2645948.1 unnamed protein product [Trifolium pratense]CAJ2645950.1 unnamed protein product [Trifolium pratense]
MGLLWWRKGQNSQPETENTKNGGVAAAGMNGAVEVPRPQNASISIFEFGSVAASTDKVTLAGYCSVSEDLEPCRWEILPAIGSNAPQFRVVF